MSVQPITAAPIEAGSAGPAAAVQRMQRLQTLIAQVEAGPAGFAAALSAAQGDASGSDGAGYSAESAAGASTAAYPTGANAYAATTSGTTTEGAYAGPADAAYTAAAGVPGAATNALPPSASSTSSASATGGETYDSLIAQAAARNGVDPAILHGLIEQESGFDPDATSSAGALGLTQLMPATATSLGVADPLDPAQSIEGGARYLGEMLREFGGNAEDALAAYNAGPGAVRQYGGVPPYSETQQYVSKVLGYAAEYRAQTPSSTSPGSQGASPAVIA